MLDSRNRESVERGGIGELPRFFIRHSNALLVCLGLTAMGVWMNLIGYDPAFTPAPTSPDEAIQGYELTRHSFYGGIIAACLAFCLFDSRLDALFKQNLKKWVLFLGIIMCISTFGFAHAFSQDLVDPLLIASATCFISGACYDLFVFIFYKRLAETESMQRAIAAIAISLIARTLLNVIFMAIPYEIIHIAVGAAIPLLCSGIAFRFKSASSQSEQQVHLIGREKNCHIALVFVICFGSIAIVAAQQTGPIAGLWGTRAPWTPPVVFEGLIQIAIVAIFATLAWFALIKRTEESIYSRYQIPFLIVVAGCLLSILSEFILPRGVFLFESIVVDAIALFTHLLSWTILVSAIKSTDASPYRIMGLQGLWFNVLAIAWIIFLEGNNERIISAILLAIFIVVIGITMAPSRLQNAKFDEEKQLGAVADKFNLSVREKEIFILLVKGRNRPYIQKHLVLADGTVKTHTYHIYSKLNVHSRQELIDLVEREIKQ